MLRFSRSLWLILGAWWVFTLAAISWWSYALVDGNLFLTSVPAFVNWQNSRWQELSDPARLAWQYAGLVISLWLVTIKGWYLFQQQKKVSITWIVLALAGGAAMLFLGHNALSHDIFNYLFNAKMLVVLQSNPHVRTALEFSYDPWVRFMHNTHTPAPYGYGWTAWSVVPFVVSGMGKSFFLTYLAMRGWMVLGWILVLMIAWWGLKARPEKERLWRWSLLAFQPLILLETLLTGHNDIWMMAPAVAAWSVLLTDWSKRKKWSLIVLLLAASISIKYVTVLLLPIFFVFALFEFLPEKWLSRLGKQNAWVVLGVSSLRKYGPDLFAVLTLIPLNMSRSQQFHPWYATWFLVWLPFSRLSWVRWSLLGLSLTSQFRYLPWMLAGFQYSDPVQSQMRLITWSGLLLGAIGWVAWQVLCRQRQK